MIPKNLKLNNANLKISNIYYLNGLKLQIKVDEPKAKRFIIYLVNSPYKKINFKYNDYSFQLPLKGYSKHGEIKSGKNFRMKKELLCCTLDIEVPYDYAKKIFIDLIQYNPTIDNDDRISFY